MGLPKSNEEPLEVMEETGLAAPTVATDGRRVYAIFPTGDIGCFDFKGTKVWDAIRGLEMTIEKSTLYREGYILHDDNCGGYWSATFDLAPVGCMWIEDEVPE